MSGRLLYFIVDAAATADRDEVQPAAGGVGEGMPGQQRRVRNLRVRAAALRRARANVAGVGDGEGEGEGILL